MKNVTVTEEAIRQVVIEEHEGFRASPNFSERILRMQKAANQQVGGHRIFFEDGLPGPQTNHIQIATPTTRQPT